MQSTLDVFQNGFFYFPACQRHRRIFLGSPPQELDGVLRDTTPESVETLPKTMGTQEFLTLMLVSLHVCQNCHLSVPPVYGW